MVCPVGLMDIELTDTGSGDGHIICLGIINELNKKLGIDRCRPAGGYVEIDGFLLVGSEGTTY